MFSLQSNHRRTRDNRFPWRLIDGFISRKLLQFLLQVALLALA